MVLKFHPEDHSYHSTDGESIDWISVTTFVSNFKEPFDQKTQAEKSTKNRKSKWYKIPVNEILQAWETERLRSTDLGTWYHNQRETDITSCNTISRHGHDLRVIHPMVVNGIKHASVQKLTDGIYPEHLVFLKSAGICGQSDLVEIADGKVHITDYKTNKEIKTESFKNWDGVAKKLSKPLHHLDDCHLNHYALQLSIYMYIILRHNPLLKPGTLTIHHIRFVEESRDKYDNPVYKRGEDGNFIVKEVVPYELPYLKSEVVNMINWLKSNRSQVKKKAA